ncbi:MAG: hypothetical protein ACLFRT_13180 [Actinomycetota bacterium]
MTAVVVLALGAVALISNEVPLADSQPVERVALGDAPAELGGEATVVNSEVSSNAFDPAPPIEMWHWRSGEGPSEWVVLFETASNADLSSFLGTTDAGGVATAPEDGQVESLTLVDTGWFAQSWVDSDTWRIAVGYDEASVAELTIQAFGVDPETVEMSGFELVYQGPQFLYPPPDVELSELFYRSPAGGFSVALLQGLERGAEAAALRTDNAERTHINGTEAVIGSDAVNWTVVWQISEDSTAFIQSSDLRPDELMAIAEAVEPVSIDEWENLADSSQSLDTDSDTGPTAESFDPIGEPTPLAAGDDWAVMSQAVMTSEDSADPGQLGLCGWVEVNGRIDIDFGCSIEQFSQRRPVQVSTPDGPVVTGVLRTEVAEVRFEGTNLTSTLTQIHPEIPYGWFAIQVPEDTTVTDYSFWSADGTQIPIDPQDPNEMKGTVQSIN